MNCRSERFAIRLAVPQDSPQLLRIYESGEFPGKINVLFTRRPDPYVSLSAEGEKAVIVAVVDKLEERICSMGACVIHKTTFNGETARAGYLTGLKSLPEYRNRIPVGAAAYRFLYEKTRDAVDVFYTTILAENTGVQKLLEKRRKNMPRYSLVGTYTVYIMGTGPAQKAGEKDSALFEFRAGNLDEVKSFHAAHGTQYNLSPVGMSWQGIRDEDCYSLRGRDGKLKAVCAVWDRQNCKQNIVTGYHGIYRFLRHIPLRPFGYFNLPRENEILNQACIAMFTVHPHDPGLAARFIKQVASVSGKYQLLSAGFFETHPLSAAMKTVRSLKLRSRLYTVDWAADSPQLDGRPVGIEVGLL